jgi:hypothetical protein
MGNWRKQQVMSDYQEFHDHWRFSSYNRNPPLDNKFSSVPLWEKKFCELIGSIPWRKLIECKRYMYLYDNVVNWDDSAVKEAFDNAKDRFWAEINGFPCDIPLPDPNIYIDNVDWNATVDHELFLELEREEEVCRNREDKGEGAVILNISLLLNQSFSGPGWGDEEGKEEYEWKNSQNVSQDKFPTLSHIVISNNAANGWESNQYENNETNSWERYRSSIDEHAKEYEWQNGHNVSQGWNQSEQYGGDLCNKYQQGRNCGNGNWNGYNINRENNMSWSNYPGYHHGNEYQMKRERRNRGGSGGGGRTENFAYVEKVPTPSAW